MPTIAVQHVRATMGDASPGSHGQISRMEDRIEVCVAPAGAQPERVQEVGPFEDSVLVYLGSADKDAELYYTLHASDPSDSPRALAYTGYSSTPSRPDSSPALLSTLLHSLATLGLSCTP